MQLFGGLEPEKVRSESDRFWKGFPHAIWGRLGVNFEAQEAPKSVQDAPKDAQEAPQDDQEAPQDAWEAPKSLPRRSAGLGLARPGLARPSSARFWTILSLIFNDFRLDFGRFWAWFLMIFWIVWWISEAFLIDFGIDFGSIRLDSVRPGLAQKFEIF